MSLHLEHGHESPSDYVARWFEGTELKPGDCLVLQGSEQTGYFWLALEDKFVCPTCFRWYQIDQHPGFYEGMACPDWHKHPLVPMRKKDDLQIRQGGFLVRPSRPVGLNFKEYAYALKAKRQMRDGPFKGEPLVPKRIAEVLVRKWFSRDGAAERRPDR